MNSWWPPFSFQQWWNYYRGFWAHLAHSSHPLPKVPTWVGDVSNHCMCQQNSSTPLSETTNLSCYHWGLRKGACSLWRMTGQFNIIFRNDGEWSTHEKQEFSAHSTHGYRLWKRLFVIWKTTDMFLTEKYTLMTLQAKCLFHYENRLWTFHHLRFTNHNQ